MATYAIGDVQGCYQSLKALLEYIKFKPQQDKLWFVGDIVNRGPCSLETLRFIQSLGDTAVVVLGNHDLHLMAVMHGHGRQIPSDHLMSIRKAPDGDRLTQWLRCCPLLHVDEGLGFVMCHAGIWPHWTLRQAMQFAREVEEVLQGEHYADFLKHMYGDFPDTWDDNLTGFNRLRFIANAFTRMRYCDRQGRLDLRHKGPLGTQAPELIPWFDVPKRRPLSFPLIFGHWASLQRDMAPEGLYPIDTGCVWFEKLTAFRLEDRREFSVLAQEKKQ